MADKTSKTWMSIGETDDPNAIIETFTAGAAITKGDPVYLSDDDTVSPAISDQDCIGIATKSVTKIIQEIVNREGWTGNNALVLLFIANTDVSKIFRAKAYETSTTQAPKLYIEWTSGGAPETYTKTWQTDTLFKKLGITRTVPD
jgi:hypothetical protein